MIVIILVQIDTGQRPNKSPWIALIQRLFHYEFGFPSLCYLTVRGTTGATTTEDTEPFLSNAGP
jgi:hypothetical protein